MIGLSQLSKIEILRAKIEALEEAQEKIRKFRIEALTKLINSGKFTEAERYVFDKRRSEAVIATSITSEMIFDYKAEILNLINQA